MSNFCPAMAVPMTVKMPEPITAPMPSAVSDHGPSVFLRAFSGSSESRISLSIDLQEPSCLSRAVLLVPQMAGIGRFRNPFVQGYPPVQDVFGRVRERGGRDLPCRFGAFEIIFVPIKRTCREAGTSWKQRQEWVPGLARVREQTRSPQS